MFEARRSIFFARYEASQFGSPYIETEHLLLGLLRENRQLVRLLPPGSAETIRKQIEAHTLFSEKVSTSVDLPLSHECKRVLAYAAEEAQRLGHKHIGTEHLFLGLIREKGSFASEILRERGLALDRLRERFATSETHDDARRVRGHISADSTVEIHGTRRDAETVRERVKVSRRFDWYWQQRPWKARDLVVRKLDGRLSFDVSFATDTENFEVRRGAWQKDQCAICRWELFESDAQPEHGIAYTNGRSWVCTECYEKFLEGPDFFVSAHPEIT